MADHRRLSSRDLERLSAYLDGTLSTNSVARLEARLEREPELRLALNELREVVQLMGSLPEVQAPGNFTLTPEMVGRVKRPAAYPVFRLATAIATLAFITTVGVDALTSQVARQELAAPSAMTAADEEVAALMTEPEAMSGVEAPAAAEPPAAPAESMDQAAAPLLEAEVEGTREVGYAAGEMEARVQPSPTPCPEAEKAEDAFANGRDLELTPSIEGEGVYFEKETAEEDILAVDEIAPSDPDLNLAKSSTTEPDPDSTLALREEPARRRSIPVVRQIEIGLGAVVVILVGVTLWLRRIYG